ncbi:hypothetical protein LCGC14_1303640 [marine sediment metagenome]|uniref:Uncharacterized protein n=1 Tax=marine sediment metagenome TaxID=412755 RepID=A0A0F9N5J3_9ZZZZ
MGKGSNRRPQFVSDAVMKARWEQAFKKHGITFIPCDMGGKIKSLGTLLTSELIEDFNICYKERKKVKR